MIWQQSVLWLWADTSNWSKTLVIRSTLGLLCQRRRSIQHNLIQLLFTTLLVASSLFFICLGKTWQAERILRDTFYGPKITKNVIYSNTHSPFLTYYKWTLRLTSYFDLIDFVVMKTNSVPYILFSLQQFTCPPHPLPNLIKTIRSILVCFLNKA